MKKEAKNTPRVSMNLLMYFSIKIDRVAYNIIPK